MSPGEDKVDAQKSIQEYLPNLRVSLILHEQVAVGPFNLSQVNFNCMRRLINASLRFNAFNILGLEWEECQRKWKGFGELFYSQDSEVSNLKYLEEADPDSENPRDVTTVSTQGEN